MVDMRKVYDDLIIINLYARVVFGTIYSVAKLALHTFTQKYTQVLM